MGFPLKATASLVLAFVVQGVGAQDIEYVDVEAERKAQQAARGYSNSTGDSRFSLGRAQPQQQAQTAAGTGGVSSAGTANASLFNQLQQLRQEVMRLNGKVEELSYEVRRLKRENLDRYKDLDSRLSGGGSTAVATQPKSTASTGTPDNPAVNGRPASAGEEQAYRSAYGLVKEQQFKASIDAFKALLRQYPDGRYAPNAHYWLGELYLVISPPDLESSRRAFTLLLDEYPSHAKVPDALFKLGKVYYLKGNPERGKTMMNRLLRDYGSSNSSAVKLAREFLKDNS